MITITALSNRLTEIGRLGENEHRRVAFDISEYLAQYPDANPNGEEARALEVAQAEFHTRVGAFLSADNRAMWAVTLTRADGRQIMQESRGAFPDMTPELEEVTDNG